jgi:hypothetical protein
VSLVSTTAVRAMVHALALTLTVLGAAVVTAPAASAETDGYVYAYDTSYANGDHCRWLGHDNDWSTCTDRWGRAHNMLNRAGSLYNRGYFDVLDKVNFAWGKGHTGAWACLGLGDAWPDLAFEGQTFTWGAGRPGYRQRINNNIASHRWVDTCGN